MTNRTMIDGIMLANALGEMEAATSRLSLSRSREMLHTPSVGIYVYILKNRALQMSWSGCSIP
jgi:hypothetical protein